MSASTVAYEVIAGALPGALISLLVIALVGIALLKIGNALAR